MKKALLILPLLLFLFPHNLQALNDPKNDFTVSEIPTFNLSSPFDNSPQVKVTRLRNNQEVAADITGVSPGVFQISLKDKTVVTGSYKLEAYIKDASSNTNSAEVEFTWGKDAPGPKFPKPEAGSYLDLYLKERPDQKDKEVIIKDANSLHFKEPDGSTKAVVVGSPINYRVVTNKEGDIWKPIDTNLKDKGDEFGGDGIPFSIKKDGTVKAKNSTYQEKTISYGLYNPDTKIYRKISDLPQAKIQGNEYVREGSDFSYAYILGSDSIKEELTFFQKPDFSLVPPQDGDWLVMETEVEGLNLPDGWVKKEVIQNDLYFPLPETKEAKGNEVFTKRFAQKQGNKQLIYTGIAASMLDYLSYPLIIDPSTTLNADTGDGAITYQGGNYNGLNTTNNQHIVGQEGYDDGKGTTWYKWHRFFFQFSLSSWSTRTIGAASVGTYTDLNWTVVGTPTIVLDEIEPFGTLNDPDDWIASVTANITNDYPKNVGQYNTVDTKNRFIVSKNDSYIAYRLKRNTEDTALTSHYITFRSANQTSAKPKIDVTYYETLTQGATSGATSSSITVNWTNTGGLVSGDKHRVYYKSGTGHSAATIIADNTYVETSAYDATSKEVTGLSSSTTYGFVVVDVQVVGGTSYTGAQSGVQEGTTTAVSVIETNFSNLDMQGINVD